MPRTKLPPTPANSTGPVAEEKLNEMEGAFVLPPAAMNRSPPTSPVIQRKRTLSGSAKNKEDLPPPPSRARKIIQMKPKDENATATVPYSTKPNSPKRKQPTATSAAGRKIARKTAHSIIERRRRSKMNEEFGVLKDMIPACNGVEMHKLAILQAGIEYVKYLQGCVEKLQDERITGSGARVVQLQFQPRPSADIDDEEDDEDMDNEPAKDPTPSASHRPVDPRLEYRRGSTASTATNTISAQPSPSLRPNISSSSLSSQRKLPPLVPKNYSTSPPPVTAQTPLQTGVSPAFNAIHFNPDLSRTYSREFPGHSPNILPLPKAAMPVAFGLPPGPAHEGHAEATATAALMMLTSDRRANGGGTSDRGRGGMSVRDLLSH